MCDATHPIIKTPSALKRSNRNPIVPRIALGTALATTKVQSTKAATWKLNDRIADLDYAAYHAAQNTSFTDG